MKNKLLSLTFTLATLGHLAAGNCGVTFGRDKLKGTTKTQGDFNLALRADERGAVITTVLAMPRKFTVEVDRVPLEGIHSIEGFETETDVVEYNDSRDQAIHIRPGNHKPGTVRIIKDKSTSLDFTQWRKSVLDGKVDRKSISVIFHNDDGSEMRVVFSECSPKLPSTDNGETEIVSDLNSKSSGHAVESITLLCELPEPKR